MKVGPCNLSAPCSLAFVASTVNSELVAWSHHISVPHPWGLH